MLETKLGGVSCIKECLMESNMKMKILSKYKSSTPPFLEGNTTSSLIWNATWRNKHIIQQNFFLGGSKWKKHHVLE